MQRVTLPSELALLFALFGTYEVGSNAFTIQVSSEEQAQK